MQVREVNPEVFFVTDRIASIRGIDLEFLKDKAERSPRRRARVCTHRDVEDQLHEMLVVLKRDTYLRPEKHLTKIESYHIIQGQADVVIFDEAERSPMSCHSGTTGRVGDSTTGFRRHRFTTPSSFGPIRSSIMRRRRGRSAGRMPCSRAGRPRRAMPPADASSWSVWR